MDRSKSHLGACQVDRGVLNVDFLWQVIDAEIHRSSKDWLLWGFIFAVGLALAVLGEWRRRKGVACHPAESAVKPAWSGYESETAWREANALQSHLVDLGRSLDGLFNPLQIDAFRLAERLQVFLKELGPCPPNAPPKAGADEPILSIMQETHKAQGRG